MSDNITKRVGLGTAYGFAKAGGYEGTVAEFTELLGNIAIDLARIENLSVTVTTLPAGSQATASLNGSVLSLGIPKGDKGDKGNTGDTGSPAGFGTVSATVDDTIGTPSVEVTASGADTAKNFAFAFHNLKGQKGDKGDTGEVSQAEFDEAVSDLKSEFNEMTDALVDGRAYNDYLILNYKQGVVHSRAYNNPIADTVTCYSPLFPLADEDLHIDVASSFKALVVYFASDSDSSPSTSSWLTGDNVVKKSDAPSGKYYFCIEIRRSDNSTITPADANGKIDANYIKPFDYYNKNESDKNLLPIKQYLGMASSSSETDLSYVRQQSNTRISSLDLDEKHKLAFVKKVSVVAPAGFYVHIGAWNGITGEGISTAWGATASYSNDNAWSYFSIVAKKIDDSAISDAEFNTFISNAVVTIEKNVLKTNKTVYVATTGSDSNTGSKSQPFATIQKGINSGATKIIIVAGTYTESVSVQNFDNISIIADIDKANDNDAVVISTTSSHALYMLNCNNVYIDGITFDGASGDVVTINKCTDVTIQNCEFNNSTSDNGLNLSKTDAIIMSCKANNNYNDGFNMHNYGNTHFYNCSGSGNGGDGISHHEECTGVVVGGYWDNNGKAGISTPTYGARVHISDAIVSNNVHGMQVYGGDDVTENTTHIKVSNVVFLNNSADGIQVDKYIVDLVNCVFSGNTVDTNVVSGTINQYNS